MSQIYQSLYDGPHVNIAITNKSLADVSRDRKNYSVAEKYYDMAMNVLVESVGENPPFRRPIMQSKATMYTRMGDHASAEPLLRETLALLGAVLYPNHPRIAEARHALGICLIELHQYSEAENLLVQSLETYRKDPDAYPQGAMIQNLEELVKLYEIRGKDCEAAMYSSQLTELIDIE